MKLNILMVDVNKLYYEVLNAQNKFSNTHYCRVNTTSEALRLINHNEFELIIISNKLAEMNGIEFAEIVKNIPTAQNASLILMTSDDEEIPPEQIKHFLAVFCKKHIEELVHFVNYFQSRYHPINGRILYIEDSTSQRMIISKMMRNWGLIVDDYETADQAWKNLKINDYDLIITDINLAGSMSGMHFVNKVRRLEKPHGTIPILAVTAYDSVDKRINLFKLGISDYIVKPVIEEEFRARVSGLLTNRKLLNYSETLLLVNHLALVNSDGDGKILEVNDKAREMFGYEKQELLGQNLSILMPEPYRSAHDGYLETYKQSGQRKILSEVDRKLTGAKKDGTHFPIYLTVNEIIIDGQRQFAGIIRELKD